MTNENKYDPRLPGVLSTLAWLFVTHVVFPILGVILIVSIIGYELMMHFAVEPLVKELNEAWKKDL